MEEQRCEQEKKIEQVATGAQGTGGTGGTGVGLERQSNNYVGDASTHSHNSNKNLGNTSNNAQSK